MDTRDFHPSSALFRPYLAGTPSAGPPQVRLVPLGQATAQSMACMGRKTHAKEAARARLSVDATTRRPSSSHLPLIHGPPPDHLDSKPSPMNCP
ncbi:mitogen-activated protein kinase kinase kinase YODA [Dorcoceras hygrometricum]|uniref:Mitogen-activated protein kinase kinase kinase YODA n=1 Tax=Dorcoceras hygrometricum TaxID=472368 RepID=A0A2Z7CKY2_9LAMI|nr:mitogen-activated protein kinase kinase kinase YODA [Dorcoceras hygrometricum]